MSKSEATNKRLLVGDNPFHGISHLSQARAASRGNELNNPRYAAHLVGLSLDNGADGFMFTVSETTLSILRILREERQRQPRLYAIVPYAYEFVRMAVLAGGVPGLARRLGKQVLLSGNLRAVANGVKGVVGNDPVSLLRSYLWYETYRLKSAGGKRSELGSIMLHEVVTDMALALNMRWLIDAHLQFMSERRITPGFETRNFPYLVDKFQHWGIDFGQVAIAAPFNPAGFQMCPSRETCEEALRAIPQTEVIAFSVLAAGYVKPVEASAYLAQLPSLTGVAVGVSKERHAIETFAIFHEGLQT
ncbi:MAG: hypothetical protein JW753_07430 [Dehalococcoidia bacterium]|nr:hypothetical protein [Dehalococcoidia bacterium]